MAATELPIVRTELQRTAKALGLPATGSTDRLRRLVRTATSAPSTWTREDFELILPYLSAHQDTRGGDVETILRTGLISGMVDPAVGLEPGSSSWTWARSYLGQNAYFFISGNLRYISPGNPRLAPGNVPLFHARPAKGGSLWDAIRSDDAVGGGPDEHQASRPYPLVSS